MTPTTTPNMNDLETLEVRITENDIKQGIIDSCLKCPTALALSRAFPNHIVHVSTERILIYKTRDEEDPEFIIQMSTTLIAYIEDFDKEHIVSPCTISFKHYSPALKQRTDPSPCIYLPYKAYIKKENP